MGLSSGHTFTDGETVTAAKLNNLVNNGTITTNTITTGMLLDDSVTSAKLGPNAVTGASISANTINLSTLSNASGGTSGTLVQSGSGGVFEELSPGATGTVLVSGGSDAALSFGTIDNVAIGATMISGHTEITDPGQDDLLLVKDKVAGVNKSLELQSVFKTVVGLDALTSATIAATDELLVIDGTTPKKITKANLESALSLSVSPSSFYHIDRANFIINSNNPSNGITTIPFFDRSFGTEYNRNAASVTDADIQPLTYGSYTTGASMPVAGEIVKIVFGMENGGSTGGSFTVVNVDPNGVTGNNTSLVTHTIPTSNAFSTSTYTSSNTFSAGDILSYQAIFGASDAANGHVLIVYKFTV